jgi:predicted deacylase
VRFDFLTINNRELKYNRCRMKEEKSKCAWQAFAPGAKSKLQIPVIHRADGGAIQLPALVVRGKKPGKTLLASAGVHGDEFEGMAALWRIFDDIDPAALSGDFIAVPLANPPAYEAGLRVNPDDRQDLARVFPGDAGGTVTEQIAFSLTHRFIRHADFYCDLHSAGQYYRMPPLVGYQLRPEPLLSAQRTAAKAFGLPLIWGTTGLPGRSLSAAAEFGVPAIYAEITGEGRCRRDDVDTYVACIRRLMAHLGMIADAPPAPLQRWVIEDDRPQAGFLQVQNRAPLGGYFDTSVKVLDEVKAGQSLGVIRDPLGNVLHEVRAGHAGLVVFLRTFPRVHAGDPVCTVLEM